MYIYIHTHTYYVLLYIYTHIHFFAFPDLNISKDQKQKSVKIRKCTGFILISTVSPAFHSDVMQPFHNDLSIFVCFTQVFSSSSFLMASSSVCAQTAGECLWRNGYNEQAFHELNGPHGSCRCDFVSRGTVMSLIFALPHAPLWAKQVLLSFSQQKLRV